MRSFVISAIIFSALLICIIANSIFLNRVSADIISIADGIAEDFSPHELDKLESYWENHKSIVGATVGYRKLDQVCEAIISLRAACESGNYSDARLHLVLLKDAAK